MGKNKGKEVPLDRTVYVHVDSTEEMIGRLIGREGRNIRTLEKLTDTDVVLPDSSARKKDHWIRVTGHTNDARLCARALRLLCKDGRVTPTIIEEVLRDLYGKSGKEDLEYLEARRNQAGTPMKI